MPHNIFITDESHFYIFDLSRSPQSRTKINLRGWESSVAAISTDLRQPVAKSSVRVVLWTVGKPDPSLENTLGQALNIEAGFFRAVHDKKARSSDREPERDSSRPLIPPYTEIDDNLITIVTDHELDDQSSVSVVLIAGSHWLTDWVALDTNSLSGHPTTPLWSRIHSINYLPLLHWCLASGNGLTRTITRTSLIFGALLPLVYSSTFSIMYRSNRLRLAYIELLFTELVDSAQKESAILDLYSQRLSLRREVENSEDDSEQLARYITSQGLTDLEKDCTSVQEFYKSVHTSALRLETEVRDYLELQSGRMALKESQKSILLSSLQIEENKRAKILTVLAFIYVPLNLATSIFGMNIHQLNDAGQSFWVFLITALVAMLVTVSAWYLTEQVNSYRKWHEAEVKDRKRPTSSEPASFSLMMRINMLIWLSLSSYKYWMIKKGVWWRLLTNSSSRMCKCDEDDKQYCEGWTTVDILLYLSTSRISMDEYFLRRFCEPGKDDEKWSWKSSLREDDAGD